MKVALQSLLLDQRCKAAASLPRPVGRDQEVAEAVLGLDQLSELDGIILAAGARSAGVGGW